MPLRRSDSARRYDPRLPGLVALLDNLYAEYERHERQHEATETAGEREVLRQLAHVFEEAKSGQGLKEESPRRRDRDVSPPPPVPPGARLVMVEEVRRRTRTNSESEAEEPRQKRVVKSNEIEGVRVKYSFPSHLYRKLQAMTAQDENEGINVTFNIPTHRYEANPDFYSPENMLRHAQRMVYHQAPPMPRPVTLLPPATPPMVIIPAQPSSEAEVADEGDTLQESQQDAPPEELKPAPQKYDVEWGPRRHTEGRTVPKVRPIPQ